MAEDAYQLELDKEDLRLIKYARLCFENIFDLKGAVYPEHLNLIAKLARLLEYKGEAQDTMCCKNCFYWKFNRPQADGGSTGICKNLSTKGAEDYSYYPLFPGSQDEWIAHTRSEFMCNEFSRRGD